MWRPWDKHKLSVLKEKITVAAAWWVRRTMIENGNSKINRGQVMWASWAPCQGLGLNAKAMEGLWRMWYMGRKWSNVSFQMLTGCCLQTRLSSLSLSTSGSKTMGQARVRGWSRRDEPGWWWYQWKEQGQNQEEFGGETKQRWMECGGDRMGENICNLYIEHISENGLTYRRS